MTYHNRFNSLNTMTLCHMLVAMPAEARPIIDHFALRRISSKPYPLYNRDNLYLTESGIGKTNAASALSHAMTAHRGAQMSCVNIGIAGAAQKLGACFLAHRVDDQSSRKSWSPHLGLLPKMPTQAVLTVDSPGTEYSTGHLFDMEASGFFSAASRYTTLEFIQCLKVISDNPEHPLSDLLSRGDLKLHVASLIETHCDKIELAVNRLLTTLETLPQRENLQQYIDNCRTHFSISTTQQQRLQRALQQYRARFDGYPEPQYINACSCCAELISRLENDYSSARRY